MESTSANGVDGVPVPGTNVLRAAAELRFGRPDLTEVLAVHLVEVAVAAMDRDGWLAAAGWRVHGAAAVGDGRDAASEVLEGLSHWGSDALSTGVADRLRLELAVVAHDAGEGAAARALLAVPVTDPDPELAADRTLAAARCLDAEGGEQDAALDGAVAAWARLGGRRAEAGAASAALIAAAVARRGGRAERAVGLAVDGLARLDRGRGGGSLTPSGHLAAALATEWISALIDAGHPERAREGSVPLRARLLDRARSTRQLALLRLTIARAAASDPRGSSGSDPAEELERAARDAAAADVPDLEHVCRTALGELYESQGRLDAALETIRLAVVADRRHQARTARFRAALAAASPMWERPEARADRIADTDDTAPVEAVEDVAAAPGDEPPSTNGNGNGNGAAERTTILRAVRSAQALAAPQAGGGPSEAERWASGRPSGPRSTGAVDRPRDPQPSPARPVRAADPWATGSWTGAATTTGAPGPRPVAHDDRRTARPTPPLLGPPVERHPPSAVEGSGGAASTRPSTPGAPGSEVGAGSPDGPSPSPDDRSVERDPDIWLATALAELDRIWGSPAAVAEPTPPTPEADGCVVVLDLARSGQRLPAAAATPTVQRVARRLADRLPPRSRLRDDGPDAVSVVLPGRDRAAASEWMHRVLPGLVDGLVVDDAASGALLRAAVHDADGVVGAQILHRLDDVRAPVDPDPGRRRGEGQGRAEGNGTARGRVPARHAAPEADAAPEGHAAPEEDGAATGHPDAGPADPGGRGIGSPTDASPAGRRAAGIDNPPGPPGVPAPIPSPGKHDESAERPPYLPDGVVVRPGSGGRRHRRGPDPAAGPVDEPSPAPQSTEGLGLADLLAGALAAYRGI